MHQISHQVSNPQNDIFPKWMFPIPNGLCNISHLWKFSIFWKTHFLARDVFRLCFTSVVILKVSGMLLGRYLKKLLEEERWWTTISWTLHQKLRRAFIIVRDKMMQHVQIVRGVHSDPAKVLFIKSCCGAGLFLKAESEFWTCWAL